MSTLGDGSVLERAVMSGRASLSGAGCFGSGAAASPAGEVSERFDRLTTGASMSSPIIERVIVAVCSGAGGVGLGVGVGVGVEGGIFSRRRGVNRSGSHVFALSFHAPPCLLSSFTVFLKGFLPALLFPVQCFPPRVAPAKPTNKQQRDFAIEPAAACFKRPSLLPRTFAVLVPCSSALASLARGKNSPVSSTSVPCRTLAVVIDVEGSRAVGGWGRDRIPPSRGT